MLVELRTSTSQEKALRSYHRSLSFISDWIMPKLLVNTKMGECPNAPVLSRGSNLHTPFQMMSVSVCWNYMKKQVECVVSRYRPEPISLFQGTQFEAKLATTKAS